MEKSRTKTAYEKQIFLVQDYISTHMNQDLNLEKIAQISDFSPFHFHRLFKAITGETLYDFIQRTRLEKACSMLSSNPDMKLISIAMNCGFSTPSSFAKAFRQHYNMSPSEYRKCNSIHNSNPGKEKSKNGTLKGKYGKECNSSIGYISDKEIVHIYNRRKKMNVKIEEIPGYRIAYMRQIGPYGSGNIQLMQRLKKWAVTRDLLNESSVIFGIAHDNPEMTPPIKCRYDCCIAIPDDYELESIINERKLHGGKYAVLPVEHTAEAIGKAWNDIFSIWLPDSGYQIDDRPFFERYKGLSKEVKIEPVACEICIPVRKM